MTFHHFVRKLQALFEKGLEKALHVARNNALLIDARSIN